MFSDLAGTWRLAPQMARRDLSSQYRGSFLGIAWAFLPAIITAVGFTLARKSEVINMAPTAIPYTAHVLIAMTLWQTFVSSFQTPINALTRNSSFLGRMYLPIETFVVTETLKAGFELAIRSLLIAAAFVWFKIPVGPGLLIAPFALLGLYLFGIVAGMLVAPFAPLFDDLSRALSYFMGVWLFLTPVVYPPPTGSLTSAVVQLNPVTPLLTTTMELATSTPLSYLQGYLIIIAATLVLLPFAWVLYRIAVVFVVERVCVL